MEMNIQFITFAVVSCVTCVGMTALHRLLSDNTSGLLGCRNEATSGKGTGSSTKQAEVLTKEEETCYGKRSYWEVLHLKSA